MGPVPRLPASASFSLAPGRGLGGHRWRSHERAAARGRLAQILNHPRKSYVGSISDAPTASLFLPPSGMPYFGGSWIGFEPETTIRVRTTPKSQTIPLKTQEHGSQVRQRVHVAKPAVKGGDPTWDSMQFIQLHRGQVLARLLWRGNPSLGLRSAQGGNPNLGLHQYCADRPSPPYVLTTNVLLNQVPSH